MITCSAVLFPLNIERVAVHIIASDRAHLFSLPCGKSYYVICEQIHGNH